MGTEASPHQISALHSRLIAGGCPYVDMGIWRPHGDDFQRAMQFTAHIPLSDGTVHVREVRGPDSYIGWAKQWKLYAYVMTLLRATSRTRLNTYMEFIAGWADRYPDYWWAIALADTKMRVANLLVRCNPRVSIDTLRSRCRMPTLARRVLSFPH